ncbi:MAG: hypothetical protein R3F29_10060 [Planctomycetota bacterium]
MSDKKKGGGKGKKGGLGGKLVLFAGLLGVAAAGLWFLAPDVLQRGLDLIGVRLPA